ncbi:hypothetical protein [Vibrio phage XZ1]|uniref:Uncharacterized protein n=2 Tax=Schizotequatrovirus valkk3 TaxID=1914021 RepID=A0A126HH51_9CAUD|nr:hypothetical protein AVU32_gp327 [Vibrio phage ValKK3]AJT61168.1 hypothetical protein [Vibrio phage ValKK3]ALP47209.1 hypothetical protein phiGrn1_0052 [Vibrio phage phi-Grn1]UOL51214.1 hypothetical protein [Vibrio phage XZ1]
MKTFGEFLIEFGGGGFQSGAADDSRFLEELVRRLQKKQVQISKKTDSVNWGHGKITVRDGKVRYITKYDGPRDFKEFSSTREFMDAFMKGDYTQLQDK